MDVIAFAGSKPIPAVANNQRITLHAIPEPYAYPTSNLVLDIGDKPQLDCKCDRAKWEGTERDIGGVPRWRLLSYLPRSLGLVLKALMQALWLLAMLLLWMPSPDVILLQVVFRRDRLCCDLILCPAPCSASYGLHATCPC